MSHYRQIAPFLTCLLLSAGALHTHASARVGEPVELPLVIYDECDSPGPVPFVPAGWMGHVEALSMEECWETDPHSGRTCIKVVCKASRQWYGVVWQCAPHDWGEEDCGYDLRKARKLTFWAKGAEGGERIEFNFGILKDVTFPDSTTGKPRVVTLTPEWKQYTLYATGDKRCIKTGFSWSAKGVSEDFEFYLDDIQFE